MPKKLTDFFTREELMSTVTAKDFSELSGVYNSYIKAYAAGHELTEAEQVDSVILVIKMISCFFNFPIILACDHYGTMLDSLERFDSNKELSLVILEEALDKHLAECDQLDKVSAELLIPEDNPVSNKIKDFQKSLEKLWNKDLGDDK